MKKKIKCFLITVFIIIFIIAGIGVAVEKSENEKSQSQEQEQVEKQPTYWYSDIGTYSLQYYSQNIAKANCNYPSTFSMTSGVKIEFLDEPNIRTSGSFKCANAFGVYESHRFVIQLKYNASSESFTLVSYNIY